MKTLGVIAARGGSKRLPGKNIKPLLDVPLLGYMATAALCSRLDRVIISTDDAEIAEVAQSFNIEVLFKRPKSLASDAAGSAEVLLHALDWIQQHESQTYDVVTLLQPTTPFVLSSDINACLDKHWQSSVGCCFTASVTHKPIDWLFQMRDGAPQKLAGVTSGDAVCPNGGVYAINVKALYQQQRIYCESLQLVMMEPERSIDIDTELDFVIAQAIAQHYNFEIEQATQCI